MHTEQENKIKQAQIERLTSFKRLSESLIATNDSAFQNKWGLSRNAKPLKDYTDSEIANIMNSGSLEAQQALSRNYFYKDGFYREILIYYATLLKYMGLLIPHPSFGKNLSDEHMKKKYFQATEYLDRIDIPSLFTNISMEVLITGSYFGIIVQADKKAFAVMDLPTSYCISRFKDTSGNDVIEFDLSYFNSIYDESIRKRVLKTYPKEVQSAYKKYRDGKGERWILLPTDISVCFQLFDGRPPFLNIIPATLNYDTAVENEKAREAEEIKKIIVQHIDHLSDGTLLFEPDEVAVMHEGAVGMMRGNPNVSVLTTYGNVSAITSKTSLDTVSSNLEKMQQAIFAEAGVSGEMFASTSNLTLSYSVDTHISFMMILARKYAKFLTNIVNSIYQNSNIGFSYHFLPVAEHNTKDYIDEAFKLASSGYSYLIPGIALGFSQRDLIDLKDLENKVLKLEKRFVPLQSAFQQGAQTKPAAGATGAAPNGEEGKKSGGQEKNPKEMSPKTEKNKTNDAKK